MEDVLTEQPPPSRFFLEDLNNFIPPPPPLPPPLLLLSPNPNPNPKLLIIAISPPSLCILHHLSPKSLGGTLILPEIPLSGQPLSPTTSSSSLLYSIPSDDALLLSLPSSYVSPERSSSVASLLLHRLRPRHLLIFDSIDSNNFRGRLSRDAPLAFKLDTSSQRASPSPLLPDGLPYLPSGSVVDGVSASLLSRAQIMNINASLCVSWPHSGNSLLSMLKSLFKHVLPDFDFGFTLDSHQIKIRDPLLDSDLYT